MLITLAPFVGRQLRKLSFEDKTIPQFVNVAPVFGVHMDSQLKWGKQIKMVAKSYS